jgi:hypothetical protein
VTGTEGACYGAPCYSGSSPITGATLTINGNSVDLLPYNTNNISEAEWQSNVIIQVQTTSGITLPYPPFTTTNFGSQNSLTTWDDGTGGVFYLTDGNHSFGTQAFLTVTDWGGTPVHAVPTGIVGNGLPAFALIAVILIYKLLASRRTVIGQPVLAAAVAGLPV